MSDDLVIHQAPVLPGQAVRHVWMAFIHYLELTGTTATFTDRECCGCHRRVVVTELWTVMPIDINNLVTGAGYLFCGVCRFGEDPSHAYFHADTDWKARRKQPKVKPDILLEQPLGL